MMKFIKRLLFIIMFITVILLNFSAVFAASINASAYSVADSSGKKVKKVYPGEEFYVAIRIDGENCQDIRAIYGSIEYDQSILELVNEGDNPIVENGWKSTDINKDGGKFFFHTQKENSSQTIGYIKVKVKDNAKFSGKTIFSIKDVNLYKESGVNSFGELTHEKFNSDVTLKIGDRSQDLINIIVLIASLVVLLIIVVVIGASKKKKDADVKEISNVVKLDDDDILNTEESLAMNSKDNRAQIKAKMREVLEQVKKEKAEKEGQKEFDIDDDNEKEESNGKSNNNPEVNEASNTDDE